MFDALLAAAPDRRLTASDYKTLSLATLGGLLEFYDFIIFVFFAVTIGRIFFPPTVPDWLRELQAFTGRVFAIIHGNFMSGRFVGHVSDFSESVEDSRIRMEPIRTCRRCMP